jgi:LEA14-like dessication related protein
VSASTGLAADSGRWRRAAALLSAAGLVAGAGLLSSGCALEPKLQTPQLSIVGVQLEQSDLWQQRLKLRMHVHNPNERALPVKSIEYTLEVAGQQFASGESGAAFVVPSLGDAEFDMSVTTNMAGTLIQLLGHGADALRDNVPYRLSGKIALSAGWLRSIPFEQQGTFKLQ